MNDDDKQIHDRLVANMEAELTKLEDQTFNFEEVKSAIKPIVSATVMKQLERGMAVIRNQRTWQNWGFKSMNSVLLLSGPPGVGKTTAARWIARQLDKKIISVTFGDLGSEKPGESERNCRSLFTAARRRKAVILLDEADGLLRSRASLSKDEQWLISFIACLLQELERYDGNVILATNFPESIDSAIARRIAYHIHFDLPDESARLKLWRALWPKAWPLEYSGAQINKLVKGYNHTGAQIEMAIENAARAALVEERVPTWEDIDEACKQSVIR